MDIFEVAIQEIVASPSKFQLNYLNGTNQVSMFQSEKPSIPLGCVLRLNIVRGIQRFRLQLCCKYHENRENANISFIISSIS
jgi:hypothetical protein